MSAVTIHVSDLDKMVFGSAMPKRVLFVGDTEIGSLGMERCLSPIGCHLIRKLTRPEDALEAVKNQAFDLVVIWMIASVETGFALCRTLTDNFPSLPVIVFAVDPDDQMISDAAYVRARACINAREPCEQIREAIQTVLRGGSLFTIEQLEAARHAEPLTPREIRVLTLVARGLNFEQVADHLGTRPGTVRNQVAEVRAKLGVRTTPAAAARARRRGLIPS